MPARKKLVVIDGYSLLFRAFFGARYMSTTDGRPTNALFGFVSMLYYLLEKERPDSVVVALDAPGKTFRDAEYAEYKAGRSETPDELKTQLKQSRDLIAAFGITSIEMTGYEADDVIGTITLDAEKNGYDAIIVTGDLDSLQLVDECVSVMTTRTGVTDVVKYGPAEVLERYGFGPELVPDYKALVGDSSDNIPGVPGVGPKTATILLTQFGSIEGIIERIEEVEPKFRKKLDGFLEQMPKSKWLATIARDAPVSFDFAPYAVSSERYGAVQRWLESVEFRNHSKRLPLVLAPYMEGGPASPDQADLFGDSAAEVLSERPELTIFAASADDLVRAARRGAAVDYDQEFFALAIGTEVWTADAATGIDVVQDHLATMAAHHSKRLVRKLALGVRPVFDTLLAAYVLQSGRSGYELADLAQGYLDESPPQTIPERASAISRLVEPMTERLRAEGQHSVYDDIEMTLVPILAEMENLGIGVDCARLREFSKSLTVQIGQLEQRIHGAAGEEFNIGSPQQLGKILYEKLGLQSGKKTKTGFATGVEVLQQLAPENEVVRDVLAWRELSKLRSTYADSLPGYVDADERIHTTYAQHIAATGRLSSNDPNLQNVPIRTEMGREIRKAFVPAPGYKFASLDYSQIELRFLAHYCGEPALVEAFRTGEDVHAATASLMWNEPVDQVGSAHRRYAKMLNYAVLYGVTDFGLANQLGGEFSVKEARVLIDSYFERFPQVRGYIDSTKAEARSKGFTTTLTGRRRYFPDIHAGNRVARSYAERQAMNAPLQGGSADMIKLAMISIAELLRGKGTRMVLQVHDELLFEVPEGEEGILPSLQVAMSEAMPLSVPVEVDVGIGPNWLETKG
ncbi:MAG: DNA polymerase I [Armatimonadota bacterium]|nr:DNA polymerase I [Armatimonadota bacterium]